MLNENAVWSLNILLPKFKKKRLSSFVGYCFSNDECILPTLHHTSNISTVILKNKHCDKKDTQNTYAFNQRTQEPYELPDQQCIPCIYLSSAILKFSSYNCEI